MKYYFFTAAFRLGARERFLMGTNVNTPFFQVLMAKFEHCARARVQGTWALNWALILCVHTFSVSSLALYPQTTALRIHNSLVYLNAMGTCSVCRI